MAAELNPESKSTGSTKRSSRRWIPFAIGFAIVFGGMLLFSKTDVMHRSGRYVEIFRLWEYYDLELGRVFGRTTLGPANGASSNLVEVTGVHLLVSIVGGGLGLGVAWWFRKRGQG